MNTQKMIPQRNDIQSQDKWDLTPLLNDEKEWEVLYNKLFSQIDKISDYKEKLADSIETFKEAIDLELSISREFDRLYTYAHLKSDEDKSNQKYTAMHQRALSLYTKISGLTSFIIPEIQSIPAAIINKYLNDARLKDFRFHIEKIIRYKPYTLNKEIEEILAKSGEMADAPSQFFSMLDNADLTFGAIKDDKGNSIELSHGNFNSFLINPDRNIRKNAFFQYYKTYQSHRNSIATALAYSVKKDLFFANTRNYSDCRKSSLFADNIPDNVYDNLINTVKSNLSPLFKYLEFRKAALGLDELHFYDTYVPVVKDIDFYMPYDEAVKVCIKALEVLGSEYTGTLEKGLTGQWVDKYENKGKRSGAYSSGCYDSPPYILMNYMENNINSLYTLIHEAGHSMHTYYSSQNQPYVYHQYTIFVAEVASTFNETLLSNYLLKIYDNQPKMKAYIVNREIDNIRATLFRQTMFAEFELNTHSMGESGQALTYESLSGAYSQLLKTYFGNSMIIDDALALECFRIPHFYTPFYVYKYATGISAALSLADKVIKGDAQAVSRYLEFLKMGGSSFPLDELLTAGVDMESPEVIKDAISYFSSLVDRMISLYKEL